MGWQFCKRSGITNVYFDLNPDTHVDQTKLEKVNIVFKWCPPDGNGRGQVIEIKGLFDPQNFVMKPKYFNATPNVLTDGMLPRVQAGQLPPGTFILNFFVYSEVQGCICIRVFHYFFKQFLAKEENNYTLLMFQDSKSKIFIMKDQN